MTIERLPSSFRDSLGGVFLYEGEIYRGIFGRGVENYNALIRTGLYDALIDRRWLIKHQEVSRAGFLSDVADVVIKPEMLKFVSYPYEWCFGQLKDAALLTLNIQRLSLLSGLTLRDASAYNVQFHEGRPVLVDTSSIGVYEEGRPWAAYKQFCQHFLGPLLLMAHTDVELLKLMRVYIDGIPLGLVSKLLPRRTWISLGVVMHVHLHALVQRHFEDAGRSDSQGKVETGFLGKNRLQNLLGTLHDLVSGLSLSRGKSEWADYYGDTNYSDLAFRNKLDIVLTMISEIAPKTVWDLGANTGVFSRLAAARGIFTVSFDVDPRAVEANYCAVRNGDERYLLPLVMDLSNPSSGMGWGEEERSSLVSRGRSDCILALALLHHLVITYGVPFERIAFYFYRLCKFAIVEYVPATDSQVVRLMRSRDDSDVEYTQESFLKAFSRFFITEKCTDIVDSKRTLYVFRGRETVGV